MKPFYFDRDGGSQLIDGIGLVDQLVNTQLLGHPTINVTGVTSDRLAGEPLARAYPHLRGLTELSFHDLDAGWLAEVADAVVLALPHLESQRVVPVLRRRGVRAVDLSADYRLRVTLYREAGSNATPS